MPNDVKSRITRNYFIHNGRESTCIISGSQPRQQGGFYDFSPNHNHGTITKATWVKASSQLWYLDFNGTDAKVAFSASALTVKTFMAWVYIDTKNLSIVDFDTGTHSVESDNSATAKITATGWASPTIYVNGTATDVVGVSAWKHIAVTTSTAFTMAALVLGQEASWYDGRMALVSIHTDKKAAEYILGRYNTERHLFGV